MATAIRFRAQGNSKNQTGEARGRMGSKILISYRIKSNEARERWFPRSRYEPLADADFEALPVYKRIKCPARKLPAPVLATRIPISEYTSRTNASEILAEGLEGISAEAGAWRVDCDRCGGRHEPRCDYQHDSQTTYVVGIASFTGEPRLVARKEVK